MLLCTTYQRFPADYFDVADEGICDFPKISTPRRFSPGLRFIKQNVPEVEILEFPLWNEYVAKLKEGWDVVGFSFHNIELDEIKKMADEARRQGVHELWAGNYGALDDRVPSLVDRVFVGPAEDDIAQVFGYRVPKDEIQHPAMLCNVSLAPYGLRLFTVGVLYTHFACPFKCTYCQTTVFNNECYPVNIESIERVLCYYKKLGISYVVALDETFGAFQKSTDKITELFARYGFNWWAQTRVEIALRNVDEWHKRGLRMVAIGVESMNQNTLNALNKRQKVEEVIEFTCRTSAMPYLARMLYYQLGFPNMTADETTEDARRLSRYSYEIATVGVITPHPKTRLWDELDSTYGIIDRTNRHWNNATLVWRHPYISPPQMKELRETVVHMLNKPGCLRRLASRAFRPDTVASAWRNLAKPCVSSMSIDDRKQVVFPGRITKGADKGSRTATLNILGP